MGDPRPRLQIALCGGLTVTRAGAAVPLPASRKTRALLAYLLLTRLAHRREALCELFWDLPDDPRGALRWSLSKLRAVLDDGSIVADREQVAVLIDGIDLDLDHAAALDQPGADPAARAAALVALREPVLAGVDLPNSSGYQAWLTGVRDDAEALRRRLLARHCAGITTDDARLSWCREWLEVDPFNPDAAAALQSTLQALGRPAEAAAAADAFAAARRDAGLRPVEPAPLAPALDDAFLQRQKINFCIAPDGVRLAYACVGEGPPLVKAANWLNHLELDWDAPIWAPMFRQLARDHTFIRYDERGNGLSAGSVDDISFAAFVTDLETVADAAGAERFPLLGLSQGCAVAIEYAARHPERVSHLILWGGYATGWRIDGDAGLRAEREAIITLVRQGWGRADAAYRQLFSMSFMPGATADELDWFNGFQRQTVSAEHAARFLEVFADIDVRHRMADVRAPTLVMHARGDRRIPLSAGGEIAAAIPNAEFVALDTDNHLLLGREPASGAFVAHVRHFLAASAA